MRWWPGSGTDAARLRDIAKRALAELAGAADRKQGRRKSSFLVSIAGGPPDHLLKVHDYRTLPFWRRLRRSKARIELARALAIAARGVPTPLPVAAGEARRSGLLLRCYELVPWLPEALDLRRFRDEGRGSPATRRELAVALGRLVRRMHDAGVDQEDLAPNNFLWTGAAQAPLLAVDFERVRLDATVAPARRARALAKLDRHCAGVSNASRMRFLLAYAGGRRDEAQRCWRDVEMRAAELFGRDAERWARTATRAGRRFTTVSLSVGAATWRGWMRRDATLELLRASLEGPAPSGCLVRVLEPLPDAAAARLWGLAQALHQRAVLPEPVALLRGDTATRLVLRPADDAAPLDAGSARVGTHALVLLVDRLLGWGTLHDRAGPDAFAATPSGRRAWLLDPSIVEPRGAASPARRHGLARERVAALLGAARRG